MANAEKKRLSALRILAVALALIVLMLAVIGALVTLFPQEERGPVPETRQTTPQVRQLGKESLRKDGRGTGP